MHACISLSSSLSSSSMGTQHTLRHTRLPARSCLTPAAMCWGWLCKWRPAARSERSPPSTRCCSRARRAWRRSCRARHGQAWLAGRRHHMRESTRPSARSTCWTRCRCWSLARWWAGMKPDEQDVVHLAPTAVQVHSNGSAPAGAVGGGVGACGGRCQGIAKPASSGRCKQVSRHGMVVRARGRPSASRNASTKQYNRHQQGRPPSPDERVIRSSPSCDVDAAGGIRQAGQAGVASNPQSRKLQLGRAGASARHRVPAALGQQIGTTAHACHASRQMPALHA